MNRRKMSSVALAAAAAVDVLDRTRRHRQRWPMKPRLSVRGVNSCKRKSACKAPTTPARVQNPARARASWEMTQAKCDAARPKAAGSKASAQDGRGPCVLSARRPARSRLRQQAWHHCTPAWIRSGPQGDHYEAILATALTWDGSRR